MNVNFFSQLYNLFIEKQWTLKDDHKLVFENFCNLLNNLDENQQQLIIELVDRYTWVNVGEYWGRLSSVFNDIPDQIVGNLKRIILFPVMKPKDVASTKSGQNLLYLFKGIIPYLRKYAHIQFVTIETFERITNKKFILNEVDGLFLLDDYLGTGDTLKATIAEILKNRNIKPQSIFVISIAAQKEAIDYLKTEGINHFYDIVSLKGISNFYEPPILIEKIELMKGIEQLIPGNTFPFGYKASEALMTMIRTPNNTFPIFWKQHTVGNDTFQAPFSRY